MAGGDGARIRCFSRTPCADGTRKSARFIQAAVLSAGGRGTGPGRPFDAERLFPQMKAIADTGLLVAFANRRDRYHEWALQIANQVTEPLLTCEAGLAETAFHLGSAALALAFVRDGLVRPAFAVGDHIPRLAELAARYADRQPDLADLCLIRLSELHPRHPVITTDFADFRVYRRGRREAIPLIQPPE